MSNLCHHIGLFTDNPDLLIDFYTEKIGFEKGETKRVPEDLMKTIFGVSSAALLTKLRLDQAVLEIITLENQELKRKPDDVTGYNHWGLSVEDKDAFCQDLKKKGVEVLRIETDGRYIVFIADPEGNLIEIYKVFEG